MVNSSKGLDRMSLAQLAESNPTVAKLVINKVQWLVDNYQTCLDRFGDTSEAGRYASKYRNITGIEITHHASILAKLGLEVALIPG